MNPIAYYSLNGFCTVLIFDIEHGIDDKVLAGEEGIAPKWRTVKYDDGGNPYFEFGLIEIPLNECIKTKVF